MSISNDSIKNKSYNLTYRSCRKYVQLLLDMQNEFYGGKVTFILGRNFPVGYAETARYPDGNIEVVIGVREFYDTHFFGRVPDLQFTSFVKSVFHEVKHVDDLLSNFGIDSKENVSLALNHLSLRVDAWYYLANLNYAKQPIEIEAERAGLNDALDFIKRTFLDVDAEYMILQYVNKVASDGYQIKGRLGREYESMDDVNKAFDNALESSLNNPSARIIALSNNYDDSMSRLFRTKEWEPFLDSVQRSKSGSEKDLKLASVMLQIYPSLIKDYPVLKDIDFSGEAVFNMAFPEVNYEGIGIERVVPIESIRGVTVVNYNEQVKSDSKIEKTLPVKKTESAGNSRDTEIICNIGQKTDEDDYEI